MEMTSLAPEEFLFFRGGGGQIGVHTYINRSCIFLQSLIRIAYCRTQSINKIEFPQQIKEDT